MLILFFLYGLAQAVCPDGYTRIPNENLCVIPTSFNSDNGGYGCKDDLWSVTPRNVFENAFLATFVNSASNGTSTLLGIFRTPAENDDYGLWCYDSGGMVGYQNWATGEPKPDDSIERRYALIDSSGRWRATNNEDGNCFCGFYDIECPVGWVAYRETGYCYYVNTLETVNNVLVTYSFGSAEQLCRSMGAHLVSFHTIGELELLKFADLSSDQATCDNSWIWGGYYGNGAMGVGNWTDGSPADYDLYGLQPFTTDGPFGYYAWRGYGGYCGDSADTALLSASDVVSRYACKKLPN